jgi:hypothetical protein
MYSPTKQGGEGRTFAQTDCLSVKRSASEYVRAYSDRSRSYTSMRTAPRYLRGGGLVLMINNRKQRNATKQRRMLGLLVFWLGFDELRRRAGYFCFLVGDGWMRRIMENGRGRRAHGHMVLDLSLDKII